jgi:predicted metal-dependent peptidase
VAERVLRARRLTGAEEHLLSAARLHAAHRLMPYLAAALFRLRPFAVDGLGTFAVDERWRLFVDPDVAAAWGVVPAAGVLLHEVGHALRDHAAAAGREGPLVDRYAFNLCADAAINDDLVAAGVGLPGAPVLPGHLRDRRGRPMPVGWTAQRYYAELPRVDQPAGVPGARAPGVAPAGDTGPAPGVVPGRPAVPGASCGEVGGGAGHGVLVPGSALDPDEGDGGVGPAAQRLVRRAVAAAVGRATAVGDVPAGLRRWARDELAPPTVAWQQQLRAAVRRGVADAAGALDTTYARPSCRRVPGVVLPGSRRPRPRVAVVLDTSASMDEGRLAAALAEVDGIARSVAGSGQRLRVVTVDAAVHDVSVVGRARELALRGGGGTDLTPGLHAAVTGPERADVVVVLTDGHTPWPARPPRAATRWVVALVGDAAAPEVPSWAHAVVVGGGS